jgi:hypothetical protein
MKSCSAVRPVRLSGAAWAVFVAVLAIHAAGAAQTGSLQRDPADIVKKYVSLDAHGARLEAISWEAEKPYIGWKDEPAWGHVVVITGYTVRTELKDWDVLNNFDVVVPVDFEVLGDMYWEQATFLSEPKVERIGFRVKAVNGMWRIVEPMVPPHVDRKRMVNYVRQAMLTETNRIRLGQLTLLRDDLRKTP